MSRTPIPLSLASGRIVSVVLMFVAVFLNATAAANAADCKWPAMQDAKLKAQLPELVSVAKGPYKIGATDDQIKEAVKERAPAHLLKDEQPLKDFDLKADFCIGKLEVTRAQFSYFVEKTGYQTKTPCWTYNTHPLRNELPYLSFDATWKYPGFDQGDDHPVVCVSHEDANAYVSWLSKATGRKVRLPSNEEWEVATRNKESELRFWVTKNVESCAAANVADKTAAEKFIWSTDPDSEAQKADPIHANSAIFNCEDGHAYTASLCRSAEDNVCKGNFVANENHLVHTLGNVWEWTSSCEDRDPAASPNTGKKVGNKKTKYCNARGGSWNSAPWLVRASAKISVPINNRNDDIGLRIVVDSAGGRP